MIPWVMSYRKINPEKNNRIKSIIAASKNRADTLHETLQPLFDNNPDLKVPCHSNCVNKYCPL